MPREMTPEEAEQAFLKGQASPNTIVRGSLYFGWKGSPHLPDGLHVKGELSIFDAKNLHHLPKGLHCHSLTICRSKLTALPPDLRVSEQLVLNGCPWLETLPPELKVRTLRLIGCPKLVALPEQTKVEVLDIRECKKLTHIPARLQVRQLTLRDCAALTALPPDMVMSEACVIEACPRLVNLPEQLHVRMLVLRNLRSLRQFPPNLAVSEYLELEAFPWLRQLWPGLRLRTLKVRDCEQFAALPADLEVSGHLDVSGSLNLEAIPPHIHSLHTLHTEGCLALRALPPELDADTLNVRGCMKLPELPEVLRVKHLDISGCSSLTRWPAAKLVGLRRLLMRGCHGLSSLPPGITQFQQLDIADCPRIRELPDDLHITGWLDLANTTLRLLPPSAAGFKLRWRGVSMPGRYILHPETLTVEEIITEGNIERRRAMIERLGIDVFLAKANPDVLDCDEDPGGERWLLKVNLRQDEPLVCLKVQDPSTGRDYLIRVPPAMRTCHQAAAWIAGFDDPSQYHPLVET